MVPTQNITIPFLQRPAEILLRFAFGIIQLMGGNSTHWFYSFQTTKSKKLMILISLCMSCNYLMTFKNVTLAFSCLPLAVNWNHRFIFHIYADNTNSTSLLPLSNPLQFLNCQNAYLIYHISIGSSQNIIVIAHDIFNSWPLMPSLPVTLIWNCWSSLFQFCCCNEPEINFPP